MPHRHGGSNSDLSVVQPVASPYTDYVITAFYSVESYHGNCVLFVSVSLALLLLLYVFDQPVHRGFFCDDDSIRYPVPTYQTVSDVTVGVVAVGVPIIVVRGIRYLLDKGQAKVPGYGCFPFQYHSKQQLQF
jgi:hypothetical protein